MGQNAGRCIHLSAASFHANRTCDTRTHQVRRVATQIEMPHDVELVDAENATRPRFEVERSIRGARTHQQRHLHFGPKKSRKSKMTSDQVFYGGPARIRTENQRIMSPLLHR